MHWFEMWRSVISCTKKIGLIRYLLEHQQAEAHIQMSSDQIFPYIIKLNFWSGFCSLVGETSLTSLNGITVIPSVLFPRTS